MALRDILNEDKKTTMVGLFKNLRLNIFQFYVMYDEWLPEISSKKIVKLALYMPLYIVLFPNGWFKLRKFFIETINFQHLYLNKYVSEAISSYCKIRLHAHAIFP